MSPGLPPPGTRIAIYARFSTHNQTEASIVRQVTNARAFAEGQRWVVVGVWEDAEKTGTTFVGRSGFLNMMLAVERGDLEGILVEDISRLSRKSGDTYVLFDDLAEMEIFVCTVASGRLVEDVDIMVGAFKNAKDVSEAKYRSRAGQVTALESGRSAGRVAYGYVKVFKADGKNGHRAIHPERAAIVRRLFNDTLLGLSPNQICTALNREGVPGPRGKGWTPGALVGAKQIGGGILRNRTYLGERIYGRTESKSRKGVKAVRLSSTGKKKTYADPDLAIVEPDTFDRVQALLEAKSGPANRHKKYDYPFSGKYRCGCCSESMILMDGRLACKGQHVKGTLCPNTVRVPREPLEKRLLVGMIDHLLKPEFIEPIVGEFRAQAERAFKAFSVQHETDAARLKEIEQRIDGFWPLLNDPSSPVLAKQALMRQLDALEGERQRLALDLRQSPPPEPAGLPVEDIIESLAAMIGDLSAALEGDEREAALARSTIRGMVDTITLTPDLSTAVRPGHGRVSVQVEGSLTQLLDLGDVILETDTTRSFRGQTMRDVGGLDFLFTFPFAFTPERFAEVANDLPILARLLDQGQVPITETQFLRALSGADEVKPDQQDALKRRLAKAQSYLLERHLAHEVEIDPEHTGWVWDDTIVSDEEWKTRALHPPSAPPLRRVLKAWAPEATVVVIGPSTPPDDGPSDS